MAADLGTGTTMTFGTSAFAFELLDVSGSGNDTREAIQTSHMGTTGNHVFIPSDLADGGEFSVEGHYGGLVSPPSAGGTAVETITIAWGGTTDTWAFSGFMTEFSPSAPLEDKMTFSSTIKVAGVITKST
jgi:hypothetical protein|tara:strand:- start:18653 stop:19042 length:390 start_codon:yes stop_codon:yes gene_type:complete